MGLPGKRAGCSVLRISGAAGGRDCHIVEWRAASANNAIVDWLLVQLEFAEAVSLN